MHIASTATTLPTLIVLAVPWPKDSTPANHRKGRKRRKKEKRKKEEKADSELFSKKKRIGKKEEEAETDLDSDTQSQKQWTKH